MGVVGPLDGEGVVCWEMDGPIGIFVLVDWDEMLGLDSRKYWHDVHCCKYMVVT